MHKRSTRLSIVAWFYVFLFFGLIVGITVYRRPVFSSVDGTSITVPLTVIPTSGYPFSSEKNKEMPGDMMYHALDLHWPDGLSESQTFIERPDTTAVERSVAYLVRWSWFTQGKRLKEADRAFAEYEKSSRELPPGHEVHAYCAYLQHVLQKKPLSAAQNRLRLRFKADINAPFVSLDDASPEHPNDVFDSVQNNISTRETGPRTLLRQLNPVLANRNRFTPLVHARALYLAAILHTELGERDAVRALAAEFNRLLAAFPNYAITAHGEWHGSRIADFAQDMREIEVRAGVPVTTLWPQNVRAPYVPKPLPAELVRRPIPIPPDVRAFADRYGALCRRNRADAALVLYDGRIVHESYSRRYTDVPRNVWSVTKTWMALLMGMLIQGGRIGGANDLVCHYVPEVRATLPRVTLRQLLTHTSGIVFETELMGLADLKNARASKEYSFKYSTDGVQLLGLALERAAGQSLREYAKRRLFEPLGLKQTLLTLNQNGMTNYGGGGRTTARELASLGQLMLQQGRWDGKQIVPKVWIRAMTDVQAKDVLGGFYGYLTWINRKPEAYEMLGDIDNMCLVIPGERLVVVRMQEEYGALPVDSVDGADVASTLRVFQFTRQKHGTN